MLLGHGADSEASITSLLLRYRFFAHVIHSSSPRVLACQLDIQPAGPVSITLRLRPLSASKKSLLILALDADTSVFELKPLLRGQYSFATRVSHHIQDALQDSFQVSRLPGHLYDLTHTDLFLPHHVIKCDQFIYGLRLVSVQAPLHTRQSIAYLCYHKYNEKVPSSRFQRGSHPS